MANNAMMYAIQQMTLQQQQQAQRQAAEQRAYLDEQTRANRPDMTTDFGSSTWTQDANGNWTNNVALAPELKALLAKQTALKSQMMDQAGSVGNRLTQTLSDPLQKVGFTSTDSSGLDYNGNWKSGQWTPEKWTDVADPSAAQTQKAYDLMMELQAPQIEKDRLNFNNLMENKGLSAGSTQYVDANRSLEDAITRNRLNAMLSAMSEGRAMGEYDLSRATGNQAGRINAGNYNMNMQQADQAGELADYNALLTGRRTQSDLNAANTAGQNAVLGSQLAGQQNLIAALNALKGADVTSPDFQGFSASGQKQAADLNPLTQWGANMGMDYMQQQAQQKKKSGIGGILGSVTGSVLGSAAGPAGAAIGNKIGSFF